MKKILFLLLTVLLAVGLIACASAREEAAENLIESMIEKEGGGDVDVEIDDDGDSIKIETEEGELTIEGDEGGMAWPADKLPVSVPEMKDVKVVGVMDAGTGVFVTFENCENDNAEDFLNKLVSNGWEITSSYDGDGSHLVQAELGDNQVLALSWEESDKTGGIAYSTE